MFYWILFLRQRKKENANTTDEFQSLFYWILFLRQSDVLAISEHIPVSILVLLDFVLKGWGRHFRQLRRCQFQSLFYWILFLREGGLMAGLHDTDSFNPCFIGFCS